ncbi:MAG: 3-hydroxyacyl-ACP dehydratase FabZ [Chloroflexi bacterium]|nr:3-hydroxyacyl-ACP dehydratase FabZ [Chloroflexota bacterium]
MMEIEQIEKIIPHRAPFLWIDRVEEIEPGVRCVASKFVSPDHPAFAGHFPDKPVLPGIFLIEALAQAAAVMLGSAAPAGVEGTPLLAAVNRFKFLHPVGPGQTLQIETRKLTEVGRLVCVDGVIRSAGKIVAQGELSVTSARP